ncbi:hypothetical protein [Agromyces subbeticus]|uniref:hypothetical protein n=1 Tax=Agromyces subbeticus TaxID=293890 RepID=UPI0003B3DBA0|nr:hypothetical protein [Agromyces subbeticus]
MIHADFEPDEGRADVASPPPRRRRVRWILAGAGVLALALIAVSIGVAVNTVPPSPDAAPVDAAEQAEQEEPTPPPVEAPMPTQAPLGDEAVATEAVVVSVNALVDATNEVLQRADGGTEGIESVATGFVEGEVQALALEREQLGYTQVGEATVTSAKVRSLDLAADPPAALLEVCIDTSDLDVLDPNGDSVADQLYRPDHPVMHLYGAVYTDGLWRVSTHEIPDGASCT